MLNCVIKRLQRFANARRVDGTTSHVAVLGNVYFYESFIVECASARNDKTKKNTSSHYANDPALVEAVKRLLLSLVVAYDDDRGTDVLWQLYADQVRNIVAAASVTGGRFSVACPMYGDGR
jgi:hypothetical protein